MEYQIADLTAIFRVEFRYVIPPNNYVKVQWRITNISPNTYKQVGLGDHEYITVGGQDYTKKYNERKVTQGHSTRIADLAPNETLTIPADVACCVKSTLKSVLLYEFKYVPLGESSRITVIVNKRE